MKAEKIQKFLILPLAASAIIVFALKYIGRDSIWYVPLLALTALLIGGSLLISGYFEAMGKANNRAILMILGIKKLPRPISILIGSVQIVAGLLFLLGMAKILMKVL